MTTPRGEDARLGDPARDTDLPWVSVRPDTATLKGPLLKGAPLIAIAALRVGLLMAKGRGTSQGSGTAGLVLGVLAVAVPVLGAVALCALRWANAGIQLDDGVLTIRNRWNRAVLHAPVSDLTGVHTVRAPADGPHQSRIVLTSRTGAPVLLDPRLWDAAALRDLWRHLQLPHQEHGFLPWPLMKRTFPGIDIPWRHVHTVQFALLAVVGTVAYLALIVNLPFLL
ncbi:hypothetical protein AB0E10_38905 [Streptomyces sp. NPDC048045]|uniref:hypothetical protein n=1 Tax=Streptomyces sp. NPDC048045 TaxID=3154710 RepID=UPI00341A3820